MSASSGAHEETFHSDWSIHPGAVLRHILTSRGIRQAELAERTGLTPKHVNQIVKESVGISSDIAILLERALGIPAKNWIQQDAFHNAYESNKKARQKLSEFVDWADEFDTETLRRHHIVLPGDEDVTRVEKILKFFGVASPEAFAATWLKARVSFRRSQAFGVTEMNTALWLRLVERSAELEPIGPLSARSLRTFARNLPRYTTLPLIDGFAATRRALADAGVALTFMREVPGTRICGATTWLNKESPVIGITARHRKPDIFWFSIAHEIGHILLHPKRVTYLNLVLEKEEKGEVESEADAFAADTLIDNSVNQEISGASTRNDLAVIAARLGVGASIVAGRRGHLTGDWRTGAPLRGKITDAEVTALEKEMTSPAGGAKIETAQNPRFA
ncbi:ImmA/IrrE family metallo-endopeptidase [Amycolatopsis kentuckyensis]|uniref:ImmA/IrrE family metallo-endopeptidase n=1 Tax=Amycolatopsis kentuckyensis TaxID=218823 RepID=UPI000A3AB48E|nr:ImmA/IrrE family metallo-endopeptidase [Amycolatopsis kentuckyensis]